MTPFSQKMALRTDHVTQKPDHVTQNMLSQSPFGYKKKSAQTSILRNPTENQIHHEIRKKTQNIPCILLLKSNGKRNWVLKEKYDQWLTF